ncbi:glycosyltransferase family 4 protein [Agrobacterium tumefaciens]|uniref:glycosyltransferase family 4 protein n=1 Tax=Agrobacterium tumefaciens TaxID=358 RepID=UPI00287E8CB6|nr:glycosyltransferase family 4 protein [Agrobacterium tumefaciens]MDS7594772.1 glycosyltransferase family 4 protein [Agrobacterium tumefaciens]
MFFVSVDWFFCSHFLQRAIAAKDAGYDVVLVSKFERHKDIVEAAGIRAIPIELERRSLNPIATLKAATAVAKIYRRERPDIVHHVAIKPILIGGLASVFAPPKSIVNAIVGMGYIFTGNSFVSRLVRPLVRLGFRLFLNPAGSKVVFENNDDLTDFVEAGAVRKQDAVLIRGAGVEPNQYWVAEERRLPPVTIFVARLLWDKGAGELIEAIRLLRQRGVAGRFIFVGDPDTDNPACIDAETLAEWKKEGLAEFLGYRSDIPTLLAQSHIACLPSHREGLPKSLLEAMAAGLPCVTTDTPGCREAVRDEDNGILVPARSPLHLANALERLLLDEDLRLRMGRRGKERIEQEFSTEIVVRETLKLYSEVSGLHSDPR